MRLKHYQGVLCAAVLADHWNTEYLCVDHWYSDDYRDNMSDVVPESSFLG